MYSIATLSIGDNKTHELEDKIRVAAKVGFSEVEIFVPDFELWKGDTASHKDDIFRAHELRKFCESLDITVSCLQPLLAFEGYVEQEQRQEAIQRGKNLLDIGSALHAPSLLVASRWESQSSEQVSDNYDDFAKDLLELAIYGATLSPPVRVGYEAISWGLHVSKWQDAWDVIQRANHANLGLIVDAFHIFAKLFADPYSKSGIKPEGLQAVVDSAEELARTVPGDKIVLFQIADGQKMEEPLNKRDSPTESLQILPWSRAYRLFPFEETRGAYCPVLEIAKAVQQTGYSGPLSLEVFNKSLAGEGEEVLVEHAQRGYSSLVELRRRLDATV